MKRFCGVLFGAFAFFVLGDSSSLRGQLNPVPAPVPDYLCEPMRSYDPGMCLSVPEGNPQGPLGNRIPVILIHGMNTKEVAGQPDLSVWDGLGRHLYLSSWFQTQYKIYYLVYLSNVQRQTVRDMGLTFRSLVERMDAAGPAFTGKQLVLIGHSLGGLIARSYMQESRRGSGGRNGDRVLRLITLGTPHHGTPLANGYARDFKAGFEVFLLHQFVDGRLFSDIRWDMDNRYDLHWDNYDGLLDYESFPENSIWMEWLNSGDTFNSKIVAYGGRLSLLNSVADCVVVDLLYCTATIMNWLLGIPESDGIVPLKSALFDPCVGCLGTRVYDGYDHSEIAGGKARFLWEPAEPLFEDIASNLLSLVMPRSAGFDNYADMGNPDDERFHSLSGWDRVNPGLLPRPDTDRTSRYQSLRGQSSVDLFVPQSFFPYRLTFRSEAGYCDDSFAVYVNGRRLLTYNHDKKPDFPIHSARVGAELVLNQRVNVTFLNTARDNCGLAAIYYVRLDPLGF